MSKEAVKAIMSIYSGQSNLRVQVLKALGQAGGDYAIAEIQDFANRWLWTYNNDRPNMALGGITPKQKLALAA